MDIITGKVGKNINWRKKFLLGALSFVVGVFVYLYFEIYFPKIEQVTIISDKIPTGKTLKILQISDVHDQNFRITIKRLLTR
jgi:predicted MPP superfamily phosphohydrolase